jgi:hypothetical protein
MKRFLFIIILFSLYFTLRAQNVLHVFSSSGQEFGLKVDSQMINITPQVHVKSGVLMKDTISIEIHFPYQTPFKTKVFLLVKKKSVKAMEFTYAIEKTKTSYRLKYIGRASLKKLPNPLVPEKPIEDTTWKINNNLLEHYCELKDGKPVYFNNLSEKKTMPDSYVGHAVRIMIRMQLEDDKQHVIEQTTLKNYVSTSQLRKLLMGVPYELDKLKLIRAAYPNVMDKENLNILSELFTYESSKRELTDFLKSPDVFKAPTIMKECAIASEDKAISELVNKLRQTEDDKGRVYAIRKSSNQFCYSLEQMRNVLKTFIHDPEKLEATKLMYYYAVKKEEVVQVSNLFSYAETETELKKFLEQFEK